MNDIDVLPNIGDLRKAKTEAEEKIGLILQEFEEKFPGFRIGELSAYRCDLSGEYYRKMMASIDITIEEFIV